MIGKKIGKDYIFIHLSAIATLPSHLLERVEKAMKNVPSEFEYNFVITHPKYIALTVAEDFDNVFEPVLGARYKCLDDGSIEFVPRPSKPKILHQRYKAVEANYEGFDIGEDVRREQWYRKTLSARDMSGAGYQHKWKEMLEKVKEPF